MSEREDVPFVMDETTMPHFAVLREFEEPVAFVSKHRMADEIVRLRAQLTTAERERDEERRERDQDRRGVVLLQRQRDVYAQRITELEDRVERIGRVFSAAEDFIAYQGAAHEPRYYDALVAEVTMERLALAVDGKPRANGTTEVQITDAMIRAAFVRLYPGCEPDEMQHYHAADIRAAIKAALDATPTPEADA